MWVLEGWKMFKSVESLLKGIAKRENNIEQQDKEIQLLKPLLNYLIDVSCLLYTSPSPRDRQKSRMPSSA